jgi:hypothetical protein
VPVLHFGQPALWINKLIFFIPLDQQVNIFIHACESTS